MIPLHITDFYWTREDNLQGQFKIDNLCLEDNQTTQVVLPFKCS
jgi:hypothetical protein